MKFYVLSHHTGPEVLRLGRVRRTTERTGTAETLAVICEVESRNLYLEAGYSSLFEYCMVDLGYSEDAPKKRIQATRAAREHADLVFPALADGRLHLSGLVLLAPHLTAANAEIVTTPTIGARPPTITLKLAKYADCLSLSKDLVAHRLQNESVLVDTSRPPPKSAKHESGRKR